MKHPTMGTVLLLAVLCASASAFVYDVWIYSNEPFNGHLDAPSPSKRSTAPTFYSVEAAIDEAKKTVAKWPHKLGRSTNEVVFHLMSGVHRMEPATVLLEYGGDDGKFNPHVPHWINATHSFIVDDSLSAASMIVFAGVAKSHTALATGGALFQHDDYKSANVPLFAASSSTHTRIEHASVLVEALTQESFANSSNDAIYAGVRAAKGGLFVQASGVGTSVDLHDVAVQVEAGADSESVYAAGPFAVTRDGARLEISSSTFHKAGHVIVNGHASELVVRNTRYDALAQPLMRDSPSAHAYSVLLDGVNVTAARTFTWRVFDTHYESAERELANFHVRNSTIHCRRDDDAPRHLPHPCGKVSSVEVANTRFCLDPVQFDYALGLIGRPVDLHAPPPPAEWKQAYRARDSPECQDA